MKTQKVEVAYLQTPVTFAGMISGESTLTPNKVPGVLMTASDIGLVCSKGNLSCVIPWANVKLYVPSKDDTK